MHHFPHKSRVFEFDEFTIPQFTIHNSTITAMVSAPPLYKRGDRKFLGQLRRGEWHNGSCERGDLFRRRDWHYEGGTWMIFSSIIIL